ncbi:MAG: hypothetical protein PWR17_587 [Candidatus Methanomethylophilaceae archaeon]|nr:hypothetical protein [Candidatus Methanomethylophilaceae archaeon]
MTYKIPDEDTVADSILIVMHKNPQIRSQEELARFVRRHLSATDPEYKVSGERIRRIGINRKIIGVAIEYNASKSSKISELCPVCRNPMVPIRNRTLDGGVVEMRRKCSVCPYAIGSNPTVPGRYFFTKKR